MAISKKSLINNRTAAKKAVVARKTTATPTQLKNVAAPQRRIVSAPYKLGVTSPFKLSVSSPFKAV